jgi:hypothetical protein
LRTALGLLENGGSTADLLRLLREHASTLRQLHVA